MAGRLQGKVALITGAASGIGRATAMIFAREGAKLVVADVSKQAEETAKTIRDGGGVASFFPCNVTRTAEVEAMVEHTVKTLGRLDCAFNNAGISGHIVRTADEDEENFDRVVAVDLKGVWLCLKYEIRQMLKQGQGGAIVNTASAAGLVGSHGMAAYTASKHGVIGLTKTAALEYVRAGIRINAVCPGVIDTPMVDGFEAEKPKIKQALLAVEPIGRKGRPEEIGEAVAWLCSDSASFTTGTSLAVDGAMTAQ